MKNLAIKLLAFQKKVGAIPKNEVNPFFKSKYADINTYIEVVKPLLSKHGLVLLQPLSRLTTHLTINGECAEKSAIRTILIDSESGEELSEVTPLPENPDPQKMGAIITYFRRYAIQSMLCLEAADDDGQSVSGQQAKQDAKPSVKPSQQATASASDPADGQKLQIMNLINDLDPDLIGAATSVAQKGVLYKQFVFSTTGLVLKTENYVAIIAKLKELQEKRDTELFDKLG